MAHGSFEEKFIPDASIQQLFTRQAMLSSDWYSERLEIKQQRDLSLWTRHLKAFESLPQEDRVAAAGRIEAIEKQLERVRSSAYLESLVGTIGAYPFHGQLE